MLLKRCTNLTGELEDIWLDFAAGDLGKGRDVSQWDGPLAHTCHLVLSRVKVLYADHSLMAGGMKHKPTLAPFLQVTIIISQHV